MIQHYMTSAVRTLAGVYEKGKRNGKKSAHCSKPLDGSSGEASSALFKSSTSFIMNNFTMLLNILLCS